MSEKVKTRFTALDVTAMVASLRKKLLGTRVNNIYDLNTKTYVFKLTRSEQKEFLILESGIRFHTTTASTEKNKIPSPFAMKLRKYLRGRRFENIEQIGVERVINMTFTSAEEEYHIIVELYASGNLILTDSNYKILGLLRSHQFTETVKTAVGEIYPFEHAANLKLDSMRSDIEFVESVVNQQTGGKKDSEEASNDQDQAKEQEEKEEKENENKAKANSQNNKKGGKKGKGGGDNKKKQAQQKDKTQKKKLKDVLSKLLPCLHQGMIDQILRENNLSPNGKVADEHISILHDIVVKTLKFLKEFVNQDHDGYMTYREIPREQEEEKKDTQIMENKAEESETKSVSSARTDGLPKVKYYEFSPLPLKSENLLLRRVENFDKCVDEFFQNQNVEKVQPKEEKKKIAFKKYENIKQDQENRLKKLRKEQDACVQKALLIEANLEKVDAIVNIIGAMVQGGLGWDKIWKMVSESKANGDPFASMITRMKLEKSLVYIMLDEIGVAKTDDHEDGDDDQPTQREVDIDIRIKAYNNAEKFYQEKKRMEIKEKKTMEASNQALKLAEKAAKHEMERDKQKSHLLIARKTYWFEKFFWFITSENYLVICGRDMQQNEMIVKKYLKKGDIYMHADIHGAASVVIKNPEGKPLPKRTLDEAAVFTVSRSKAWDSKIVTSAWWVYDNQVSKTAPSGEYLPTGSFMIRGKKNFMNPSRLEMGFGFLFKVDDMSLERHMFDRRPREEESEAYGTQQIETQKPEEDQHLDSSYYITGQVAKPIIQTYDKSQNQNKAKQQQQLQASKKPTGDEEESGSDEEEEEDPFKALKAKKAADTKNQKNQQKGGADKKNDEFNTNGKKISKAKQNKIKKMKEKYGDQDEEERELRMNLIGAQKIKELRPSDDEDDDWDNKKGGKNSKGGKNKGKNDKGKGSSNKKNNQKGQKNPSYNNNNNQNKGNKPNFSNLDQQKKKFEKEEENKPKDIQFPEKNEPKPEESKPEEVKPADPKEVEPEEKKISDIEVQKQEKDEKKQNSDEDAIENYDKDLLDSDEERELKGEKSTKTDDNQSIAPSNFEEEKELSEADELRKLVSNPLSEDQLLFCVPVCAPYITMMNYKYKVKLVPGGMKRGKAVKMTMSLFHSQKDIPELEKKLMRSTNDTELVAAMIGSVKIGAAGMLKVKDQQKKAKQDKKKDKKK